MVGPLAPLAITGVVLAGGKSTRMGRDKASIEVGGETLAKRAVNGLWMIFHDVIAAANDPAPFAGLKVRTVPDRLGSGPLAGIAAALEAASDPLIFCCAVDMPFLVPELVRHLCGLAEVEGYDIVVPRGEGEGRASPVEPTFAVYGKGCLSRFQERLAAGRYKIDAAFEGLHVRVVEPEEVARHDPRRLSFRNVNTPEDLQKAIEELGQG